MHHDAEKIRADYELSEKLGAELLIDCSPLAPSPTRPPAKFSVPRRHVNLLTGEVRWSYEVMP